MVGYQTITINGSNHSGYTMLAINWEAVGGDAVKVQELFSADDLAKLYAAVPGQKATADRIMIWNPTTGGYSNLFLRKNAQGVIQGWADLTSNAVDQNMTLEKGSAMWYFRQQSDDVEVTLAGQVSAAATPFTFNGTDASGYTMFGAGYAQDFMLNDGSIDWAGAGAYAAVPGQKATADRIMIWNPTTGGYSNLFLRKNAQGVIQGWADLTSNTVDANACIPAGAAAWYYRQQASSFNATQLSPIAEVVE